MWNIISMCIVKQYVWRTGEAWTCEWEHSVVCVLKLLFQGLRSQMTGRKIFCTLAAAAPFSRTIWISLSYSSLRQGLSYSGSSVCYGMAFVLLFFCFLPLILYVKWHQFSLGFFRTVFQNELDFKLHVPDGSQNH